jgi:hypothetical protein
VSTSVLVPWSTPLTLYTPRVVFPSGKLPPGKNLVESSPSSLFAFGTFANDDSHTSAPLIELFRTSSPPSDPFLTSIP